MKNSKEYSKKIQQLYRSLKRQYPKPEKPFYDEPSEAIVYAIVSENMTDAKAQATIKKFADSFIDINDLRVSRADEIVESMPEDTPVIRNTAMAITTILGAVFAKYNTVSLMALKKTGKRQARQTLEKLTGTSRFVVDYCLLTALQGHSIPLTEKMLEFLRANELVHPEADQQDIAGFLARQISANKAYEFYALLRRCSESRKSVKKAKKKKEAKKKKKAKAVKKTKKKAKRKTKTKSA